MNDGQNYQVGARREIFAARSEELPWELRIEWSCQKPIIHPRYTYARAGSEELARKNACYALGAMERGGNPRVVGAAVRGPGEELWQPVDAAAVLPGDYLATYS